MDTSRSRARRYGAAAAVGTGLLAGALLLGANAANAADTTTPSTSSNTSSSTSSTAPTPPSGTVDESKPVRPDEKLLTGDTATKVREAALAKYPGATVLRLETDSDGVYEAHLVKADGSRVTVEVGKDFAVTGEESMPAPPSGAGNGSAPAAPAPSSSTASGSTAG